jgi:hypothetical protein
MAWLGSNVGVFVYNSKWFPRRQSAQAVGAVHRAAVERQDRRRHEAKHTFVARSDLGRRKKYWGFARNLKANDPAWVRGQTGKFGADGCRRVCCRLWYVSAYRKSCFEERPGHAESR